MRFPLGVVGCLVAGCSFAPTSSIPRDAALAGAGPPGSPAPAVDPSRWPPSPFVLRLGVEHLPPGEAAVVQEPRLEPCPPLRPPERRVLATPERSEESAVERKLHELATTDDVLADEALHFVSDLLENDRRRVRREVGLPFFDFHEVEPDRGPLLISEEDLQRDHEQWVQEHGARLLQRPTEQLLRRLPFVRDVEVGFDSFRSEHLPLSEPYQAVHDRSRRDGRVSVRVHTSDLRDPLEVAWIWHGVRVGSSRDIGKLSVAMPLAEQLSLELRARTEYASGHSGFRLDCSWRASPSTSVHVAIGDDMDFLSTSSVYSLFETTMDGSPGLVLYAVHIF